MNDIKTIVAEEYGSGGPCRHADASYDANGENYVRIVYECSECHRIHKHFIKGFGEPARESIIVNPKCNPSLQLKIVCPNLGEQNV